MNGIILAVHVKPYFLGSLVKSDYKKQRKEQINACKKHN